MFAVDHILLAACQNIGPGRTERGGGPPLSPFLFPGPIFFFEMSLSDLSQTLQIAFCVEGSLEAEAGD